MISLQNFCSGMVASNLWNLDGREIKVLMAMIAFRDTDGLYRGVSSKLAWECGISKLEPGIKLVRDPAERQAEVEAIKAVKDSIAKLEAAGMIQSADVGSWTIPCFGKLQDQLRHSVRKERLRRNQAAYRKRHKNENHPSPGLLG